MFVGVLSYVSSDVGELINATANLQGLFYVDIKHAMLGSALKESVMVSSSHWSVPGENVPFGLVRPGCASAQFDQGLYCLLKRINKGTGYTW